MCDLFDGIVVTVLSTHMHVIIICKYNIVRLTNCFWSNDIGRPITRGIINTDLDARINKDEGVRAVVMGDATREGIQNRR